MALLDALPKTSQLEQIGFVDFTTGLVKNVYLTIVEASMEQLKAYSEYVEAVSQSLQEYQNKTIGVGNEQEDKVTSYIRDVLELDPSLPNNPLTLKQKEALAQHFAGVTVPGANDGDKLKPIEDFISGSNDTFAIETALLRDFVLNLLKSNAEETYKLLKTVLQIGMQKVVVTNGEILAKLTFYLGAAESFSSETYRMKQKGKSWNLKGKVSATGGWVSGGLSGGISKSSLKVSVVNERTFSAAQVGTSIVGEVKINFKTESYPLLEA